MRRHTFPIAGWQSSDVDRLRALYADLASVMDPAFASSATWTGTVTLDAELMNEGTLNDRWSGKDWRYADPNGPRAVVVELRDWWGGTTTFEATGVGLAVGHTLTIRVRVLGGDAEVTIEIDAPAAIEDAVLARCSRS